MNEWMTPKRKAAWERNWLIFQLRGMWRLGHVNSGLSQANATRLKELVDDCLRELGAATETERVEQRKQQHLQEYKEPL